MLSRAPSVLGKVMWGCSWKGGCTRPLAVYNLPNGARVSKVLLQSRKSEQGEPKQQKEDQPHLFSMLNTQNGCITAIFCAWSSFILTLREICNYFWLRFKAEMQCVVYVRILCQCECIRMCALIDCSYGFSSPSLPALQHRFSCYP